MSSFILVNGEVNYVHKIGKQVKLAIPYSEVILFKGEDKYIAIVAKTSAIYVEDTLKKILERHDDLLQVHRSMLVKKDQIVKVWRDPLFDKHYIRLKDDSVHIVSRRCRKSVYYWCNEHLTE